MKQPFKFFPRQFYDGILLVALLYVSNRRILICLLSRSCLYVNALADYILWGLIVLCSLLLLIQSGMLHEYWLAWKRNWPLALFIIYSIASISWSIVAERSIHTVYVMVAASLTAAIFGVIYSANQIFKKLFFFTLVIGILSLILAIVYPSSVIHQDKVWYGAWHGIFGHKNDFGPLMALGNGLSLLFLARSTGKRDLIVNILAYFLTLFLIVMSRSATALVLWAILNGLCLIYFAWIKWRSKLVGKNLFYTAGLSATVALLAPVSLIAVSLLMGKSPNLTGRIPLWINLLKNVVSKKPWFGYGMETLWYFPLFQKWASITSGWGDAIIVVNGHNGYMDILLYLGIVGLAILCIVLAQGFVHAIRRALIGRAWLDFSPLLVFVYFLVANMTIDYILEFESFHWVVLVMLLFLPLGKFVEQEFA